MIKTSLYGKTKRFNDGEKITYVISEKIDGANLGIGKYEGRLYVATRNQVFNDDEFDKLTYGGLKGYIDEHHDRLLNDLKEGIMVFGKWIGEIKEKNDIWNYHGRYNNKFIIFAQAKFKGSSIENRSNNILSLLHAFNDGEVPSYLPVVEYRTMVTGRLMGIGTLDALYSGFIGSHKARGVNCKCKGFIIYNTFSNGITKYIRMNRKGEMVDHTSRPGKDK